MKEEDILSYWAKKEAERQKKYPDGNYPPLERWSLPLSIKRSLELRTRRATRHAAKPEKGK